LLSCTGNNVPATNFNHGHLSCNHVFREASLAPAHSAVTFSTVKIAPYPLPLRYALSRLHEIGLSEQPGIDLIVQMVVTFNSTRTGKNQERRLQSRSSSGTPGYETVDEVVREIEQNRGALHKVRVVLGESLTFCRPGLSPLQWVCVSLFSLFVTPRYSIDPPPQRTHEK
jgi:hypothetical protein